MERQHIEFVQSQNIDWIDNPGGSQIKILSEEPTTGERAALIRYPEAWRSEAGEPIAAEEFFVLDGRLQIDGVEFSRNYYAFLPHRPHEVRSTGAGALLLSFRFASGDPNGYSAPIVTDSAAMPWDTSVFDPQISHLQIARKNLRYGPNNSGRTYLLSGLPHGLPRESDLPVERHPHSEEAFLIYGEMKSPEGIMTAGAYTYRPPGIDHGPHVSEFGFLTFMRQPGSNTCITEWSERRAPLPIDAPYAPRSAFDLPEAWHRSHPVRPVY